jgi:hypothetical protein
MSNFSQFQEEMVEQFRAFFEEQLISKEALISNQESTMKDLSNQN